MHPLTVFEIHRQEQAHLLRQLAHARRLDATRPGDDARGRPPERPARRPLAVPQWSPAAWHMAP